MYTGEDRKKAARTPPMHLKDEQKKKAIERQAHSVRRLIVDRQ
jgi:hypothetical protein